MTPFAIASTINPDTKTMTVHYDGCEIRLEPAIVGIDVLVNRHINFKIVVNNKVVNEAGFEELRELTFQGKSNVNTIRFEQNALQPKQEAFQSDEPIKLDFKYKEVFFSINGIPVRHTMHDPMDKIGWSLMSLKWSLGFNLLILVVLLIQSHFIDAFIYSFIASMTFIAILSSKRYHLFGLAFGSLICMMEIVLYALGLMLSEQITSTLFIGIAISLKFRVILLYYISTGITSAWKLSKFNKQLHAELATKSF